MNSLLHYLKTLIFQVAADPRRVLVPDVESIDSTLRPMGLTKSVQTTKRIGYWRGCAYELDAVNGAHPAETPVLYRTMYWRGCRYDVVIPSLNGIKATVLSSDAK